MSKTNDDYQATCRKCNGEGDSCSVCQGRGYVQYAFPGRSMVGAKRHEPGG